MILYSYLQIALFFFYCLVINYLEYILKNKNLQIIITLNLFAAFLLTLGIMFKNRG